MAARISPSRGKVRSKFLVLKNTCCISQETELVAIHAMEKIKPMSPTRL